MYSENCDQNDEGLQGMSCKETAEESRHVSPRAGKTQGDVDSALVRLTD